MDQQVKGSGETDPEIRDRAGARVGNLISSNLYRLEDSGERATFDTGCQRDTQENKAWMHLLPVVALERDGQLLRKGALKYDERNWEKGMDFSRCVSSMLRHAFAYLAGERGDNYEDHLAAVRFNAACLMHYEGMIDIGKLPADLDDLPNYLTAVSTETPPHYEPR